MNLLERYPANKGYKSWIWWYSFCHLGQQAVRMPKWAWSEQGLEGKTREKEGKVMLHHLWKKLTFAVVLIHRHSLVNMWITDWRHCNTMVPFQKTSKHLLEQFILFLFCCCESFLMLFLGIQRRSWLLELKAIHGAKHQEV